MGSTYIYTLSDPDTGAVRYVGKANDVSRRFSGHMRDAASGRRKYPLYNWIRKLTAKGKLPAVSVVCEVPAGQNWQNVEREMIARFAQTSDLLNLAEGGDEPKCSVEVRRANGMKSKGWRKRLDPVRVYLIDMKHALSSALRDPRVSEDRKASIRSTMRAVHARRPDLFPKWGTV